MHGRSRFKNCYLFSHQNSEKENGSCKVENGSGKGQNGSGDFLQMAPKNKKVISTLHSWFMIIMTS